MISYASTGNGVPSIICIQYREMYIFTNAENVILPEYECEVNCGTCLLVGACVARRV